MGKLTGIVLCGGQSTRMGRDKASLPFGDETLLERAVRIVGEVTDDVIVVARPDHAPPPGIRIVHDFVEHQGPLAGIAAGLAASTTELNIVMACDMPLARSSVLRRLLELCGDADICVAVVEGRASPLCAVYRSSVAVVAEELLAGGERRVMALLDRVQTKRAEAAMFRDLDPDLESFVSCNTPEQLQWAALKCRPPGTTL